MECENAEPAADPCNGQVSHFTDDGRKVYFSGEENRHEYGVGFLMHKDRANVV